MVDRDVVFQRLSALRLNARRLARAHAEGRERFVSDEDLCLRAERCLALAIRAMLSSGE